jgi:hypothetical protein
MQVRHTAVCFYCARRFAVPAYDAAGMVCFDDRGRICCVACLCDCCLTGHATEGDRLSCVEFHEDNYGQDVDPDNYRDAVLDTLAGVI